MEENVDQNGYGEEQYCTKCGGPLEKARVRLIHKAKCIKCKKAQASEYYKRFRLKINKK